jgi:hypothetical protein
MSNERGGASGNRLKHAVALPVGIEQLSEREQEEKLLAEDSLTKKVPDLTAGIRIGSLLIVGGWVFLRSFSQFPTHVNK